MPQAVSIALVICGTILVVFPPLYPALYTYLLALAGREGPFYPLPGPYWLGTFALGAVMIVVAIIGAFFARESQD